MKRLLNILMASTLCVSILSACGGAAPESSSSAGSESAESASSEIASSSLPAESQPEGTPAEQTEVKKGDPDKKAILVVSFGTSYNDSREATIGAIEKEIASAFPEYQVRRAFTSQIIIDKLKSRDNLEIDNVKQAMERLIDEGVGTLICQPTHVMHGLEYDDMVKEVNAYADHFETLKFGEPLLSSTQDYRDVVAAINQEFTVPDDTALVLMGHGTEHFANNTYAALAYYFSHNNPNILVGTVEGFPDLETTVKDVKELGVKKVILTPLMVVAGDHANNDMAGDEEGSWKTVFKSEGYEVEPVLKGLGEYQSIRDIYVAHVAEAIKSEETK
ncbi:sirohydrochlorin cobaltochelatase [Marasmitruncus massiliensis]|uniref:sirohydrochlorin cobaltochelatase n=1 Tax=Marasmitruncus massiliensis TaxID=1944642 RepID=UPI001FA8B268|nr:sirohydrochlorin cobaltochelatase [Marasmitruncus massiliensis]